MSRRTLGVAGVVLGLALLAASLLADQIGLGGMPGVFGWKQMVGAVAGVAVMAGGIWIARRGA